MARTVGIGHQDFETVRQEGYFYIDKTDLIRQWWESGDAVTLITRPRRFGKTLNMSMLRYFFEIGSDSSLFDGLIISREKELCEKYQGKFPVISITLKGV